MKKLFANHSIPEACLSTDNSFLLLRLLSAIAVLFDHSFLLLEKSSQIYPVPRYIDASALGVWSFFFISGFLVTRSWFTRKSVVLFTASRFLRILPALWLTLFVTVFVLGPSMTTLRLNDYLSQSETWTYLWHNLFLRVEMTLPHVFSGGTVNGSLWTLPYEFQLYVLVCLLGWLVTLSHKVAMSNWRQCAYELLVLLAIAWLFAIPKQGLFLPVVLDLFTLPLFASFGAGAVAYFLRDRISLRLDLALILLIYMSTMPTTSVSRIAFLCGWWYLLLILAFYPFPQLLRCSRALKNRDFSYGIYLSAFPIQQIFIHQGTRDPWHLFGLSLACSIAWAAASWHYVEKPCIGLKQYFKASSC